MYATSSSAIRVTKGIVHNSGICKINKIITEIWKSDQNVEIRNIEIRNVEIRNIETVRNLEISCIF